MLEWNVFGRGFDSRRLHSTRFLLYKKRVECPEPVEGQLHVPLLYKKRVECPEQQP